MNCRYFNGEKHLSQWKFKWIGYKWQYRKKCIYQSISFHRYVCCSECRTTIRCTKYNFWKLALLVFEGLRTFVNFFVFLVDMITMLLRATSQCVDKSRQGVDKIRWLGTILENYWCWLNSSISRDLWLGGGTDHTWLYWVTTCMQNCVINQSISNFHFCCVCL